MGLKKAPNDKNKTVYISCHNLQLSKPQRGGIIIVTHASQK